MIEVTRLNGKPFTLNALYIETVEAFPDTQITLTTGRKFIVLETEEQVRQKVHNSKPGQRFIADVEKPDVKSDNNAQREKRIRFYSRNGYEMTDVEYRWHEENYLIMVCNGDISKDEHRNFWERCSDMLQQAEKENSSLG